MNACDDVLRPVQAAQELKLLQVKRLAADGHAVDAGGGEDLDGSVDRSVEYELRSTLCVRSAEALSDLARRKGCR